ncbi:NUDIX domain-containing protein [Rhodococcus sp. NPDC127530]|uniref:NUDIX domain-containing protein n=1 Tax=unclassified Rhodococcus (in: high G+C Gram-positive bacteria) TaxID=192944 RepID=UPI00362FFA4A
MKSTWPGVWTNSCSGRPCPGEKLPAAVTRRVDAELGIIPADITLILPDFRCRTITKAGIRENSICPVYRVTVHTPLAHPDPNEVEIPAWIPRTALVARAGDDARSLTPCCRDKCGNSACWAPTPVAGKST